MTLQEKVDQAFKEGINAFYDCKDIEDNPYNKTLEFELWEAWNDGFDDARWDNFW